jgi:hypothetical protein
MYFKNTHIAIKTLWVSQQFVTQTHALFKGLKEFQPFITSFLSVVVGIQHRK